MAQLALFDFEIRYRPGKNNAIADGLSRMPQVEVAETLCGVCSMHKRTKPPTKQTENVITSTVVTTTLPDMSPAELELSQQKDIEVAAGVSYRKLQRKPNWRQVESSNNRIKMIVTQWDRLCVRDGILHHVVKSRNADTTYQLVLPVKLHRSAFEALHNNMGHLCFKRTLDLIHSMFYWPHIYTQVKMWCEECR